MELSAAVPERTVAAWLPPWLRLSTSILLMARALATSFCGVALKSVETNAAHERRYRDDCGLGAGVDFA